MKRVLVDKDNKIVYEGTDAKEILRILNADIYSVSEDDEIKYEHAFRPLIGIKGLRYEVHFDLKFKGFDDWDRPVFKDVNSSLYFGSVNHLRGSQPDVVDYLKTHPYELEYFGDKFNCEPHGGKPHFFKFNIIN